MTPCGTILIIEDDLAIREALAQLLQFEGYEVREANNGQEGLDLLPTLKDPCLVLLDLMMPVMDGWEFLSKKQNDSAIAAVPVLVVSAVEEAGITTGSVGIIKKPIEFEVLLEAVKQHCS